MEKRNLIILIAVVALVGVLVVPLGVIWSLNELFSLDIAYNWRTWLASLTLSGLIYNGTSRSKNA